MGVLGAVMLRASTCHAPVQARLLPTAPRFYDTRYKKPVPFDTGFLQRIEDRMKKKTLALASIRIPEGCYEKNPQMLQKH